MYKAILIDDEAKLRKVLQIKLEMYCGDIQIVGMAGNVKEGQEAIKEHDPDLVFLDIAMPGGTGFDLLEQFDPVPFEVIFVTGYNNYVLDALKVSATDYLLKPIITEDLVQAVEKAKLRIESRQKAEKYDLLKHNLNHLGDQEAKVAIPGNNAYDFVRIFDIIRCEGWQKYTRVYLADGACIVSSYNLGVFKDMLENYGFYSTHKSHLINIQHINRYLKEGIVVLSDSSEVPIARRKKEEFVENILKDFLLDK